MLKLNFKPDAGALTSVSPAIAGGDDAYVAGGKVALTLVSPAMAGGADAYVAGGKVAGALTSVSPAIAGDDYVADYRGGYDGGKVAGAESSGSFSDLVAYLGTFRFDFITS